MAIQERRNDVFDAGGTMRRFVRTRPVLLVAAVLFAGLVQFAGLAAIPAVIGFAVIALAVLIREAALPGADEASIYGERTAPLLADRMVDAIIAGLSDPALALAPDSQVVAFNASAQQIMPGISRGEPISFALRVPDVLEAIRAVAASRQSQRVEFFERVPTDRWWEATIAPLLLPGETPNQARNLVLLTLRDLTPLRLVEEMRSDFVANASHELRTPLASLSGFIETLQGPARSDAPARDRFLAIMKEQATRMARLIDDLLSLSRIEQKAHIHPDNPVDLGVIVRQVADGLSPLAHEREVEVKIADQATFAARSRRPRRADPGVRKPDRKCVEIRRSRPPRRHHAGTRAGQWRGEGGGGVGARLRPRHRAGAPAAPDRAVLPGRHQREPRPGRNRARARPRQAHSQPPPRPPGDRKHARRGGHFRGPAAAPENTGADEYFSLKSI